MNIQKKFEMGSYIHGLWTSSLARDIAWTIWGVAALGRPRTGPSWSWAYSSDSSIEWPDLYNCEYYQLLEIIERPDKGERVVPMLSLTGILLAVSLQTWTQMSEFENIYSLSRYCRVIQHGGTHYNSSSLSIDGLSLRYPPLPGSYDDPYNYNDDDDDDEASYRRLQGHFSADYKFWSTEEALQRKLQRMIFFAQWRFAIGWPET
jgi:hypothetical protein